MSIYHVKGAMVSKGYPLATSASTGSCPQDYSGKINVQFYVIINSHLCKKRNQAMNMIRIETLFLFLLTSSGINNAAY